MILLVPVCDDGYLSKVNSLQKVRFHFLESNLSSGIYEVAARPFHLWTQVNTKGSLGGLILGI